MAGSFRYCKHKIDKCQIASSKLQILEADAQGATFGLSPDMNLRCMVGNPSACRCAPATLISTKITQPMPQGDRPDGEALIYLDHKLQLAHGLLAAGHISKCDAGAAIPARLSLALRKLYGLYRVIGHLLSGPAQQNRHICESCTLKHCFKCSAGRQIRDRCFCLGVTSSLVNPKSLQSDFLNTQEYMTAGLWSKEGPWWGSLEDAEGQGDKQEAEGECCIGIAIQFVIEWAQAGLVWCAFECHVHQLLPWAAVLVLGRVKPEILLKFLLCLLWHLLLIQLE